MNKEPIKLSPAFKDYLWGGTKLKTHYNKQSDLDIVAESWELSTHPDGQSVVACGVHKGKTLSEYIELCGAELLGERAREFSFFPILIKFIDAKQPLSIQVHPDDAYALEHTGGYGKTEMWYVLDCEEGASLYYGFNRELTKEEFQNRIENNTLLEVLNEVKVKKGDVFFIEAGTVHAIGGGIMICEIQQNSNTTYRVYDYDRRDAAGNPRPLHIADALEVSTLAPAPAYTTDGNTLASCKYFTVEKHLIDGAKTLEITDKSFHSLIAVDGACTLRLGDSTIAMNKGDSVFIPAQNASYTLTGSAEIILSYV